MKKPLFHLFLALLFSTMALRSQILTTLVNFNGSNGSNPVGIIQGSDGNFYGTTAAFALGLTNQGTVFKMTSDGTLITLASFTGTNGRFPYAGLIQGNDGNFYGTTADGGTNNTTAGGGTNNDGTIFQITSDGVLKTLVNFNGTNGAIPEAALVQGNDGNFYGTTYEGGDLSLNFGSGYGTVFKMTPDGTLTTLVDFNETNGANPSLNTALITGNDGNFYGTTVNGGTNGYGTVFKITTNGVLTTLVNFNGTSGSDPFGVIQANDGNFYGTTLYGGNLSLSSGYGGGTIFKVTTNGVLTTLANFNGTNGLNPQDGLIQASDGNFYGTAFYGGTNSDGTVFKVTSSGAITALVNFNGTNGNNPSYLMQGSDGNLYGTTFLDGSGGNGTIFKITGLNLLPAFQSITLTNGTVQLVWNSVSNWTYRVQYKTNLNDANWTDLSGDVLATNVIAGKMDTAIPAQRFYRLLLLR
jgi:uncharacterized repeat protein (TIGR03803 family)